MRLRPSILLAVLIASPSFALADADVQPTPFVAALMQQFSAWDTDADGELERPEIERAVYDPAVTGDAAAVAAALRSQTRSRTANLPPLTRAYFEQYSRDAAAAGQRETATEALNATVDPSTADQQQQAQPQPRAPRTNWDRQFLAGKARLALGGEGPIWRGTFEPASMKQGPLGDCFFIAVTGSLVMRDPARINAMVQPVGDGSTYRASFPNSEPFTFAAPTQATLALSGTTANDGAWIAVLEQAFGKHKSRLNGGSLEVDGTDILRSGGDSIPTIQALTGHRAHRVSLPHTLEARAAAALTKLPEIRQHLIETIASGRIAVVGILPPSTSRRTTPATQPAGEGESAPATQPSGTPPIYPRAIVKRHVYSVVNYDPSTDMLELWNPHSNTFTPSGPEGLVNGYKTVRGRFKIPLTEACQFYTAFTFETAELAPAPTTRRSSTRPASRPAR